jgi:hypothetical protein
MGDARLTLTDGRMRIGRVVRVTNQFVVFETDSRSQACEDIDLSRIAAVQWLRTPRDATAVVGAVYFGIFGVFLVPFYIGHAIADPFKRIFPPLKPLRGTWEHRGPSFGEPTSTLEFSGKTVAYSSSRLRRGRWSVQSGLLGLSLDGEPESLIPFHFKCEELVPGDPPTNVRDRGDRKRATLPIVGEWHGLSYYLDIRPDGV